MRKFILLFFCTAFFISCKKEQTQPQQPYVISGRFSFQFNGNTIDRYGHNTTGTLTKCRLVENGGSTYLRIEGNRVPDIIPEVLFYANIKMPSNAVVVGDYNTSVPGNFIQYQSQYDSRCYCYDVYNANDTTSSSINFKIESYDASTKEVTCSYSGTLLKERSTTSVAITFGKVNGKLP